MTGQFNRPPRLQPELPIGERVVPNPPQRSVAGGSMGLIALVLPMISIVAYSLIASRGGNILFMLPMGITTILSGTVGFLNWRTNQRAEKEKQENYAAALADLRREMEDFRAQQSGFLEHNYPPAAVTLSMAQSTSERLFERRPGDADFGAIRLGVGLVPATMELKPPSSDQQDAPHSKAAAQLVNDFRYLKDAPLTMSLSATNAIGIAANNTKLVSDCGRAMIAHLTAFHAPHELRLFIIGGADARAQWSWARWLPHCASQNPADESRQLCFDPAQYPKFWDQMQYELERRELLLQEEGAERSGLPLICVLVDATQINPLDEVNAQAPLSMLMRSGRQLNAAVIFLVRKEKDIPEDCQAVLKLSSEQNTPIFSYEEIGVNGPRRNGIADHLSQQDVDKSFARHLTDLVVRTTIGAEMPNSITLLDLLKTTDINGLPIIESWRSHLKPGPFTPQVNIGRMAGGKDRILVFDQNTGDGAHGLIAGTSGSGKSQLLMTMVAGMALQYPAPLVNFVLVDYKGGTTFEPLKKLPHTVDVITNMSGQLGTRVFTAMGAELRRRETLLVEAGVPGITEYYEAGKHLHAPLPHLFFIIDEFAEMIRERDDLRGLLDSIARKGRALGIHLILATQRPGGLVSDQIQANVKLRICLRVETADDSRELLGRADASFLPRNIPGRAYIRVGKDLDLIQVAQVGFTYQGPAEGTVPPVIWHNRAKRAPTPEVTPGGRISLLDVVVNKTLELSKADSSVSAGTKPWFDPLPEKMSLAGKNAHVSGWMTGDTDNWGELDWETEWMAPVVGVIDQPANAAQLPLVMNLARGNVLIVGTVASGKTTIVYSTALALAASHSPAQLVIYGIDTSRSLTPLNDLPHTGSIVFPDEAERVQRMFRRLAAQITRRRLMFEEHQVNDLAQYNTQNPDSPEPAILVIIDSLEEFVESAPNLKDTFSRCARDGQSVGIRFLVTADQARTVAQFSSLFTERLSLALTDVGDYLSIIGRRVTSSPEVEGRGYLRLGASALEFQTAIMTDPVKPLEASSPAEPERDLFTPREIAAATANLIRTLDDAWTGTRPPKIQVLRTFVGLDELVAAPGQAADMLTLGVADTNLEPFSLDLATKGPHLQLLGSPLSGKTTLLQTIALSAAWNTTPDDLRLVLIEAQGRLSAYGGQRRLSELPHVLSSVESAEDFDPMVTVLRTHLETLRADPGRKSRVLVLIDNYEDIVSLVQPPSRAALLEVVKVFGRDRCTVIMAGLPNSMNDNLASLIKTSRYGIALSTDALSTLSMRLSTSSATELPMGRGFVVNRDRLLDIVQFATPQRKDMSFAESLDKWINEVSEHRSQPVPAK